MCLKKLKRRKKRERERERKRKRIVSYRIDYYINSPKKGFSFSVEKKKKERKRNRIDEILIIY